MSREISEEIRNFAKNVKSHRDKQKLTQEALSTLCNLEPSTIYRIEHLKRLPSLDTAIKISKGLNISLTKLIEQ